MVSSEIAVSSMLSALQHPLLLSESKWSRSTPQDLFLQVCLLKKSTKNLAKCGLLIIHFNLQPAFLLCTGQPGGSAFCATHWAVPRSWASPTLGSGGRCTPWRGTHVREGDNKTTRSSRHSRQPRPESWELTTSVRIISSYFLYFIVVLLVQLACPIIKVS